MPNIHLDGVFIAQAAILFVAIQNQLEIDQKGFLAMRTTTIKSMWQNTKKMPFILGTYCQGVMLVTPLFLFCLVFPMFNWSINGKLVTYGELWSSGAGFVFGICFALAGIGGWGLAARWSFARWAWVAAPTFPILIGRLFPPSSLLSGIEEVSVISSGVITSVVIYAALFHVPAINHYLAHIVTSD